MAGKIVAMGCSSAHAHRNELSWGVAQQEISMALQGIAIARTGTLSRRKKSTITPTERFVTAQFGRAIHAHLACYRSVTKILERPRIGMLRTFETLGLSTQVIPISSNKAGSTKCRSQLSIS